MKWSKAGRGGVEERLQTLLGDSDIGCGRSEPSRRCGSELVSLSEQVDTGTPTGKIVFTVLGAVAELERSLIAERVRAGLRNARAKGKKLGRPRVVVDATRIAALRRSGGSWAKVCRELGVSKGTAQRALQGLPKNPPTRASVTASV